MYTKYILFILLFILCSACSPTAKNEKIEKIDNHEKIVITTTPSLSELVCAFQQDSNWHLVAVDKYSVDGCASGLPKIDPMGSAETIATHKPDIVFMHSGQKITGAKLQKLGIEVEYYDMDTIAGIEQATREIGKKLDNAEIADMTIKTMSAFRSMNISKYKSSETQDILIIVDKLDARMQQFYIATEPSYLADIVKDCGFNILAPDQVADSGWTRISSETLMTINPAHILYLAQNPEDAANVTQAFKQNYPMLDAIQSDGLLVYDNPQISIPGPSIFREQGNLCKLLRQND